MESSAMDFRLPGWLRPGLVLLLLTCLLTFSGLNRLDLRESTEPREAGIAADMLQQGQFLVPTLNGRPFLEKPPLSYWLQGAAIRLFGYEAFAPRLPSVSQSPAMELLPRLDVSLPEDESNPDARATSRRALMRWRVYWPVPLVGTSANQALTAIFMIVVV